MSEFWKRGYDATGLANLERATQLGRQSLYGAFGNKRALFSQVVEHYFARVLKPAIVDVLDAPGSGRANIERVLAQWAETAGSAEFNGCLVGNAMAELGLRDRELSVLLQRKLDLLEAAFGRALRRAKRAGEVRADLDVRAAARTLLTMAQGLAVVARVQRDSAFVRDVITVARQSLD
ncbi:MAG TPA: TetR family transcriptional regulator C-terminal domain-containing protein [Polyangiaceae bacterium]|nr:TetR family transcriptional regulator C-terminal domain-containing protein [Polyangiaceae bacterium]